jgi:2-polyprenyl-3-methyl-5-hydroxy-6-metoxy-1,4-benzoquinol methylase
MSFMSLKGLDCPACGFDQSADHKVYNGHQLKRCNRCALVFTAERSFSTAQYEDVYSGVTAYRMMMDGARLTHEGKKGYNDLWWFKRKALKWLHMRVPKGRLLDLGSGPGTLLMIAREKYGYEVQGVEPASAAAEVANRYGVPTYCGTVEEFAAQHPEKFDAITAFEVLEHVADPLSFLTAAKKLLNRKGILLLSMPNLDDPYCLRQPNAAAMCLRYTSISFPERACVLC